MTFEEWLEYGFKHGYCSEQFCETHDGGPWHESEMDGWENGEDPCRHMVRLGAYDDWDIGK